MSAGSRLIVPTLIATQGIVIPIVNTAERNALYPHESATKNPEGVGALVYNSETGYMEFYDGIDWTPTKAGKQVQF